MFSSIYNSYICLFIYFNILKLFLTEYSIHMAEVKCFVNCHAIFKST